MSKKEDMEKLWSQIVKRAWKDEVFKQRLLKDPKKVAKDEYHIDIPSDKQIMIVEASLDTQILRLPLKPASDEMSSEELEKLAAGGDTNMPGFVKPSSVY